MAHWLAAWVDRIELVVDDERALLDLRRGVASGAELSDDARRLLDGRIGTYLADLDRERKGRGRAGTYAAS